MGPVNWLAVILAAGAALLVAAVWNRARSAGAGLPVVVLTALLLLLTSAMMGHMFARVGYATLAAKPWLYFMMSGGLAGAFVVPAVVISYAHRRLGTRAALIDAGFWLAAYLAMGLVFFLLKA